MRNERDALEQQRFRELFAERLRQGLRYNQRNRHPMTQHALAEATGLHYSLISCFARAKRTPSAEQARRIAVALNVSADWLLGIREQTEEREA